MDNISDSRETVKHLGKEITSKEVDGGFRDVKYLTSVTIVVKSCPRKIKTDSSK